MLRRPVVILSALLLPFAGFSQTPAPSPQDPPASQQQILTPEQLDNLVAPVALYPDPLLGQVMAASTYPLELVEAHQWVRQNSNLKGQELIDAAKRQNWDPSVQALVAFPDAMTLLTRDVSWTTQLGDAFLAQQADVMAAVQRMRSRAEANGRLETTQQQTVTTQSQNGQTAIVIQPATPQVIYVPVYNPDYVWGPPVWGYYPPLWYPTVSFGFGFGPGCYIAGFYPGWASLGGWGGWGGWGWGLGWFGGGMYVNTVFFSHYGYHEYYGGYRNHYWNGYRGRESWAHNPEHRLGVGYGNHQVAARYDTGPRSGGWRSLTRTSNASAYRSSGVRSNGAASIASRGDFNTSRNSINRREPRTSSNWRSSTPANGFRSSGAASIAPRGDFNTGRNSIGRAPANNFRTENNFRSLQNRESVQRFSAPRNFSRTAPAERFSAPRNFSQPRFSSPRSFSAPRSLGGSSHFSAPRSSGGGHFGGGGRGRR